MAQSQFTTFGAEFGVSSNTKTSYSSAYTMPITADTYGKPIPLSRGKRPIVGHLLWSTSVMQETKTTSTIYETTYSPFDAYEVHEGLIVPPPPPDPVTTIETTKMTVDCAVGFGASLNSDITPQIIQLRAGSTIVFDSSDETLTSIVYKSMKLYNGNENQLPDPLMEKFLGVGNVPAYRGEILVVFEGLDILAFGGVFPEITAILADNASGTLEPVALSDVNIVGRTMVPDWTRNLLYVRDQAQEAISIFDVRNFIKLGTLPVIPGLAGLSANFDACHWLNYIITFNGMTIVIDAVTGAVLFSDDWLDDTMFHLSQVVDIGTSAPIYYVLCGSFFGPIVLYQILDDGTLLRSGLESTSPTMEAACRGLVAAGVSHIYLGEGSKIYKVQLDTTLIQREIGDEDDHTIPFITASSDVLHWLDLNDFDPVPDQTISNIGSINFFDVDSSLIIYARTAEGDGAVIKVTGEGKVQWVSVLDSHPTQLSNWPHNSSRIVSGHLGVQENNGIYYDIDCYTGLATNLGGSDPHTPSDQSLWDGQTQSFFIDLTADDQLYRVSGGIAAGGRIPISIILTELGIYVGFEESQIIVDPGITNIVDGMIIENGVDTDFWTLTKTWGSAFLYAVFESGQGIEFKLTVAIEPVPTYDFEITIADLATMNPTTFPVSSEDDPMGNAAILSTRAPDADVVDYVKMTYKDIGYDYGENTVYRQRARVPGDAYIKGKDLTIDIAELIMTTDEAASLVSNILFSEIVKRTNHEWRLPGTFGHILPGDTFSITLGQFVYKIKVTQLTYHYDFSLSLFGQDYYADVSLITTSGQTPVIPPLAPVSDSSSQLIVFDTPSMYKQDDIGNGQITVYYGVAGMGQAGWKVADVYRSETGGIYDKVSTVNRELVFGRCLTPLLPPEYDTLDYQTSFEMLLVTGDPKRFYSVSDDSFFRGGFIAVVGAPGRWEIISIQNFEPVPGEPKRFICSGFLRGLRDTYMHINNHAAGDQIIFPMANSARRWFIEPTDNQGDQVFYKAAGGNQEVSTAIRSTISLTAEAQRPMSVVGYRAVANLADDLTLTWNRQSRIASQFVDSGPEISVNEFDILQFKVEIKDGPGGTIVRTETIDDASTYVYLAVDQATDGLILPLAELTFQVTQMSTEFGAGRVVERTVMVEH